MPVPTEAAEVKPRGHEKWRRTFHPSRRRSRWQHQRGGSAKRVDTGARGHKRSLRHFPSPFVRKSRRQAGGRGLGRRVAKLNRCRCCHRRYPPLSLPGSGPRQHHWGVLAARCHRSLRAKRLGRGSVWAPRADDEVTGADVAAAGGGITHPRPGWGMCQEIRSWGHNAEQLPPPPPPPSQFGDAGWNFSSTHPPPILSGSCGGCGVWGRRGGVGQENCPIMGQESVGGRDNCPIPGQKEGGAGELPHNGAGGGPGRGRGGERDNCPIMGRGTGELPHAGAERGDGQGNCPIPGQEEGGGDRTPAPSSQPPGHPRRRSPRTGIPRGPEGPGWRWAHKAPPGAGLPDRRRTD